MRTKRIDTKTKRQKMIEYWDAQIEIGREHLLEFGNWAVPPKLVQYFGFEAVEQGIKQRLGKNIDLRYAHYHETLLSEPITYYIAEKKR